MARELTGDFVRRDGSHSDTYKCLPAHGTLIGFIVLTEQPDGTLKDDWDGEVHPTLEEGRAALREASQAGITCILTECKRVAGSG